MKALIFVLTSFFFCSQAFAGDNIWVDVRSAGEYQQGHVEQAIQIPHTEIADKIATATTDKSQTIYVYCRSGRRSSIAKKALEELGYTDVINLGGLVEAQAFAQRNPKQ